MSLGVIILAAGQGTRMKSARPKVLHELAGRPLLQHVIDCAKSLGGGPVAVVYGHGGEQVRGVIQEPGLHWVEQEEQLEIDAASREVRVRGEMVSLRAKEFDLLLTLVEHKGMVLSREQLIEQVWGFDFFGQTRTVDVHVAHLRSKLAGSGVEIETVWGVGYKLVG